jgi:hypothetical protein
MTFMFFRRSGMRQIVSNLQLAHPLTIRGDLNKINTIKNLYSHAKR